MTARLTAVLALVAFAQLGRAQAPHELLPHNGSEYFRFALHQHGVSPLTDPAEAMERPGGTMIVVLGRVDRLHRVLTGTMIVSYLENGGSILIATDEPSPARNLAIDTWSDRFGIHISDRAVTADPGNCYKELAGQPFVRSRARVDVGPSPFDLFEGAGAGGPTAIATNHPSAMTVNLRQPGKYLVKNLAGYPIPSRFLTGNQPLPPEANHFAVSIEPQRGAVWGRMIVMADQSVFVNGMMGFVKDPDNELGYRSDNGNWAFTNRTIEWMQGGRGQPRSRCLFIENGQVIDQFATEAPGPRPPPVPPIPPDKLANAVLNLSNPLIEKAQEQDFFNRMIESKVGFPRLVRLFVIVMTVLFVLAGLRWLTRGQRKAEPAATMTPLHQANLLPRGGVLRQRTASQIEVGNLYDAARRRVRERFDVLGGRPGPGGQMPPVLTANDLQDGPLVYQSVRWLWALGYGDTPVAVPPADWDRTNLLLERVTARAARGDWSFGQDA